MPVCFLLKPQHIYQLSVPDSGVARLGVVADTHIPDRMKALPPRLFDVLDGVDLVLHAGDISHPHVLDELARIAPVAAVQGNRDFRYRANWRLPLQMIVQVGDVRIGMAHGHGGLAGYIGEKLMYYTVGYYFSRYEKRMLNWFNNVQALVFGHSHHPVNEVRDGVLLFNPGSVGPDYETGRGAAVGMLTVDATARSVRGQIIPLSSP
ncbi:MAG TPA: metallophosphoesterase family protein [Anaerolineales bacterium]|nr:metallophosphoesterase family protein [Anaerolineales bacterium]